MKQLTNKELLLVEGGSISDIIQGKGPIKSKTESYYYDGISTKKRIDFVFKNGIRLTVLDVNGKCIVE